MKWSTTVSLAFAPLAAMAASHRMRNTYPVSVNPRAEAASQLNGRTIAIINGMKGYGLTLNARTDVILIWYNPGNDAPTTNINDPVTVTVTAPPGHGEATATPPAESANPPAESANPPAESANPPAESATTTASESETTTAPAAGASHTVQVGGTRGLIFDPEKLNIPVGDSVIFEFLSQNHTVTQSSFKTPCVALEGGMDSGFLPNPNNTVIPPPQVAMQVNTTDPLWFFCAQLGHCGKAMVFSINDTPEKTHALFQSMAIVQNGTGKAAPITGGTPAPPPPANAEEPKESTSSEPAKEEPTSAEPAEEPAATATPSSPAAGGEGEGSAGATPGQGTVGPDGSCTCVVACNAGGFPAAAQGAGAFGGFAGTLPTKMAAMR